MTAGDEWQRIADEASAWATAAASGVVQAQLAMDRQGDLHPVIVEVIAKAYANGYLAGMAHK